MNVTGAVLLLGMAALIIWLWGTRDVAASVTAGTPEITYKGIVGTTLTTSATAGITDGGT